MEKFTRQSAGYYTATVDGQAIEIESADRAIENGRGWIVWVNGQAPSCEFRTLTNAKAAAIAQAKTARVRTGRPLIEFFARRSMTSTLQLACPTCGELATERTGERG